MPPKLEYVDPNIPRGMLTRLYATIGTTRPGRFLSRHLFWKLDPFLLRVSGGRLSMALPFRTAVLETKGAKSGASRRNAVIYFHDGDTVTIVASNAGATRHPDWYHNLRAHPEVLFGGIPMRAEVISDQATRERLWTLADRVFGPFARYRRDAARTDRTIPIVQLVPTAK